MKKDQQGSRDNSISWLLTAEEVATRLGISRSKVYELLRAELPSIRIGRCRRVDAERLRQWIAEKEI